METTTKIQRLEDITSEGLVAYNETRNEILALITKNSFIEVTEVTHKDARERRTALRTARTKVQKDIKTISSGLNQVKKEVTEKGDQLIALITPHEEKQQTAIDSYDNAIEEARLAAERIETARVLALLEEVDIYDALMTQKIINVKDQMACQELIDEVVKRNADCARFEIHEEKARESLRKLYSMLNTRQEQIIELIVANDLRIKQEAEAEALRLKNEEAARIQNEANAKAALELEALKEQLRQAQAIIDKAAADKAAQEQAQKDWENKELAKSAGLKDNEEKPLIAVIGSVTPVITSLRMGGVKSVLEAAAKDFDKQGPASIDDSELNVNPYTEKAAPESDISDAEMSFNAHFEKAAPAEKSQLDKDLFTQYLWDLRFAVTNKTMTEPQGKLFQDPTYYEAVKQLTADLEEVFTRFDLVYCQD